MNNILLKVSILLQNYFKKCSNNEGTIIYPLVFFKVCVKLAFCVHINNEVTYSVLGRSLDMQITKSVVNSNGWN